MLHLTAFRRVGFLFRLYGTRVTASRGWLPEFRVGSTRRRRFRVNEWSREQAQ